MKIQIGDINLLSPADWINYNLAYFLCAGLFLVYFTYYILILILSDLKNNQTRYILPLTFEFEEKNITQYTIEKVRDLLSQVYTLSNNGGTNDIIGLNILSINNNLNTNITSTSKSSLEAIKEVILKNRNLKIKTRDIFDRKRVGLNKISINEVSSNENSNKIISSKSFFKTDLKLQRRDYPIKNDSVTFGIDLLHTVLTTQNVTFSVTLVPNNQQRILEQKSREYLVQKQTDKGIMYLSEQNKNISKQFEEKSKYPIFLTRIELLAPDKQTLSQISSQFSILSTNQNRFYYTGIRKFNRSNIQNRIQVEYWCSWLMPKTSFYLNTQELACIWEPIRIRTKVNEIEELETKLYKL